MMNLRFRTEFICWVFSNSYRFNMFWSTTCVWYSGGSQTLRLSLAINSNTSATFETLFSLEVTKNMLLKILILFLLVR